MVFCLLCVFSVTANAVVRGFCSYWPGPDWGFLSPLMVLGDGRWFGCLRGFRDCVAAEVLGRDE